MLRKSIITLFAVLLFVGVQAQDKEKSIKPFRLGFKIGIPNIVGGNAEYVFGKRFGVYADYSAYSGDFDTVAASFNYFEAGANVYFNPTGKGFYGSFAYGSFNLDGTYTDSQTSNGQTFTGEATGSLTINTINAKLGLKMGRTFYMRTEVGYGFGTVPDKVIIHGNVNGTPQEGSEDIPNIPGISSSGLIIFNLGFGFGF